MTALLPASRIRPARPGDHQGIASLPTILALSPSNETSWPPAALLANDETETWVATLNKRLIGVGIAWRNAYHPGRRRVSIGILPDHRRQGTARALWDRLDAGTDPGWQTAVDSTNLAGQALLDALGFDQIMRTHLTRHRPSAHRPRRDPLPQGWRLEVMADASGANRAPLTLARLHRDLYAGQHAWDPPIALPDDEALDLFVHAPGAELRPRETVLAVRNGVPLGIGSLRGDPATGTVDLGWTGVLGPDGEGETSVIIALTDWCLVRAAALGVDVDIEVDDANAPVLAALGAWGVVWEREWLTCARDRRPSEAEARPTPRR